MSNKINRINGFSIDSKDLMQNLTNTFIRKIDELLVVKEAEIMKV